MKTSSKSKINILHLLCSSVDGLDHFGASCTVLEIFVVDVSIVFSNQVMFLERGIDVDVFNCSFWVLFMM